MNPALVLALVLVIQWFDWWVTAVLWRWFCVPLGLPSIGVIHIAGLTGLLYIATWRYLPVEALVPDQKKRTRDQMLQQAAMAVVTLIVGWLLHLAM